MQVRNGAFGVAAVAIGLLAFGSTAWAQWGDGGTPIAIDFSGNGSARSSSAAPSFGRHASLPSQVATLSATTEGFPASQPSVVHDDGSQSTLLQHLFVSGIADLVRGNLADAAEVFKAAASATDEIPQLSYLTALAQVLSDFDHRDQALPAAKRALARDPDHPLYRLLAILADRELSLLQPDGALYFTPDGARRLHAAIADLPAQTDAYNGTYLAALFTSIEKTADPALPERLPGFATMIGDGRSLRLVGIDSPQALGRLFVLSIPPAVLARGEARFLAGLGAGSESTSASASARVAVVADRSSILVP
jgi:tetratricopeptide (TPR) repeat protein